MKFPSFIHWSCWTSAIISGALIKEHMIIGTIIMLGSLILYVIIPINDVVEKESEK